MSDDLAARMIEAAARAANPDGFRAYPEAHKRAMRAAIAALCREAGLDALTLNFVASDVEAFGHPYDDHVARLLRALGGIADAE